MKERRVNPSPVKLGDPFTPSPIPQQISPLAKKKKKGESPTCLTSNTSCGTEHCLSVQEGRWGGWRRWWWGKGGDKAVNKKQMHLSGIFVPGLIQDSLPPFCCVWRGLQRSKYNKTQACFFITSIDAVFIANPKLNKHLQADSAHTEQIGKRKPDKFRFTFCPLSFTPTVV